MYLICLIILFVEQFTRQDNREDQRNELSLNIWRGDVQDHRQEHQRRISQAYVQEECYSRRLPLAVEAENWASRTESSWNGSSCSTGSQDNDIGQYRTDSIGNRSVAFWYGKTVAPFGGDGLSKLFILQAASEMVEATAANGHQAQQNSNNYILMVI